MGHRTSPRARLLVNLPVDRYRIVSPNGRAPLAGDEVALDQGSTSPDGLPMVLAHLPATGAALQHEADVYESELGPELQ